jgi:carboxypeptidase family protein
MRQSRTLSILAVLAIMLWAQLQILQGQVVNGTIFGTVRDPSGAVISQVTVSARNVETGAVRTAATDPTGTYQVLSVPAGDYEVEAVVSGFKTSVRKGISVTVGASVAVNFDLPVGDVQQKVEVEATPPQVETANASMGGLVGETAVRELPLNGRDWLQLGACPSNVRRA